MSYRDLSVNLTERWTTIKKSKFSRCPRCPARGLLYWITNRIKSLAGLGRLLSTAVTENWEPEKLSSCTTHHTTHHTPQSTHHKSQITHHSPLRRSENIHLMLNWTVAVRRTLTSIVDCWQAEIFRLKVQHLTRSFYIATQPPSLISRTEIGTEFYHWYFKFHPLSLQTFP